MNNFGERIRDARKRAGMSLRALAREADVSPSFLSQIENGKSHPSVATLYGFARALDVSLDELFESEGSLPVENVGAPEEHNPVGAWAPNEFSSRISVIHPDHRARIEITEGIRWERLAATPEQGMAFMRIVYEPGAGHDLVTHPGYEYGYVLTGKLEVTVGSEVFVLGPGDALGFDSTIPHVLRNVGEERCEGVWFLHMSKHAPH